MQACDAAGVEEERSFPFLCHLFYLSLALWREIIRGARAIGETIARPTRRHIFLGKLPG